MDIKPIRTEADHETSLAEVESLWQAPPGSPESDRLEILTTLVEAYEEQGALDAANRVALERTVTGRQS